MDKFKKVNVQYQKDGKAVAIYHLIVLQQQQTSSNCGDNSSNLMQKQTQSQQYIKRTKECLQAHTYKAFYQMNKINKFKNIFAPQSIFQYQNKCIADQRHYLYIFPKGSTCNIVDKQFYINDKIVQQKELLILIPILIRDIISTIVQLESYQIYHYDLKFRNFIWFGKQSKWMVIDYGETRVLDPSFLCAFPLTMKLMDINNQQKPRNISGGNNQQNKKEQMSSLDYEKQGLIKHKEQALNLLQELTSIKHISFQKQFSQIYDWYINVKNSKDSKTYQELINTCNQKIEDILKNKEQEIDEQPQAQIGQTAEEGQQDNMQSIIEEYIKNSQYNQLIHLCHKQQELQISREYPGFINQESSQEQEYQGLQIQKSACNSQYTSQQSPLLLGIQESKISSDQLLFDRLKIYNQESSQEQEYQGLQIQKSVGNSQYISQQSPLLLGTQENKISSEQLLLDSIKSYNQNNDASCEEPENPYKGEVYFEQQSKQQSCHHQTISKVCLSINCIEKNNYLLCGCQQEHIKRRQRELEQCHIIDIKDFSKLTKNLNEKIKQWGSQQQYLNLLENFQASPLSKIEQYYKQIMQNTISQLQSLTFYDEIINKQFAFKNIDEQDYALKLGGLYSFSRFNNKIQFDQFIQFTSDSLERSSSKIIELAKQQVNTLKIKIDGALHCNKSTNIVKNYLNQKYRTVVDNPEHKGRLNQAYQKGKLNNSSCVQLYDIKQHHLARIENLTLGSQTQQTFEEQSYNSLKNKLQQLHNNNTQNNNDYFQSQSQKIRKSLQGEYKQQSHLCKTLKFINQNNYCNLKSLEIDLNDSKNSNKYEFSQFDLFSLISKTSISNLKVNGLKIVQFQQFIRVLYEFKQNESEVNRNVIFDDKRDYSYIQNFHKSEQLTIQIDIQIRFIFKFKESMKKKKQQLFYFLDHIKQLKSITLTLQFSYQGVDQLSLQLIQELMQHPKIRCYRLNIHKLQVRQYDNTLNLFRALQKISQKSNKIVALQFQNVQFGQLEKLQTEKQRETFENMLAQILGNHIKQYSAVNCHAFPMINIDKTSLTKLNIFNTKFKTKIEEIQRKSIQNKFQSLCINNSKDILQQFIRRVNFKNLKHLNITLDQNLQQYLANQSLPLLEVLIIQRQKYEGNYNKFSGLSKLLSTIQRLQVLNVQNIAVNLSIIEKIKSNDFRKLKLSHLVIEKQQDLHNLLNLFKRFHLIFQLSLTNIVFSYKESNMDQFYDTFNAMQNLRKLIIDIKIIDSNFGIERLRNKGVIIIINKNPYQPFQQSL